MWERHGLTEHAERLAHHATRGELGEKSVHYLRQAGGKAAARSALQDARACFEQALGALEALPESLALWLPLLPRPVRIVDGLMIGLGGVWVAWGIWRKGALAAEEARAYIVP